MRNYEIVFLVHPDQSDQTSSIISKLEKSVNDSGGNVHRAENIGNRKLAYPIQDQFKASYGLLNIECNHCLLYTSPSPRDLSTSRMPSSA